MKFYQKVFRKLISFFYKPALTVYLKKVRLYNYNNFQLQILPGVFHPGFFYSTHFLLQYLNQINFEGKTAVEVGAGNGLISFNIAQKAKKVIALDLSKTAIQGLRLNHQLNSKWIPSGSLEIIESNLFKSLNPERFNFIIVNPPYYPNKVNTESQLAWNCGEAYEYFFEFFKQVVHYMNKESRIIMVLSSQCNIKKINEIANDYQLQMCLKQSKSFLIEDNYIYEFTKV